MKDMTKEQLKLRQFYVLNLLTNMNANYAAEKKEDLNENILKIDNYLRGKKKAPGLIDDWKVVWGPAVGNSSSTRIYPYRGKDKKITRWATDNALYVAKKQDVPGQPTEYFIGISGTNGISLKGWFDQDFDVAESVSWPPECLKPCKTTANKNVLISKASSTGLTALWELNPALGAEQKGTSLIKFLLDTVKDETCSISVGGHSLGGCLTPLLATAISDKMNDSNLKPEDKGRYKDVRFNAYPTAGPTPGNQYFAKYLQERLTEYHAVFNANDLVPLSWGFEGLPKLQDSFGNWKFGDDYIDPKERLIVSLLYGVSLFSNDQNKARTPKEIEEKFQVTTWDNAVITQLNRDNDPTVEGALKALVGLMLLKSVRKELNSINKYKKKYGFLTLYKLKNLSRFLMQVLLQHLSAYNNPVPNSNFNGELPWKFSDDENKELSELFKRADPPNDSIRWAIATSIVLLSRLTAKAAKCLLDNPTISVQFFEEENISGEFEGQELDTLEFDGESLEIFEKLLEESPELANELPFIRNPYS